LGVVLNNVDVRHDQYYEYYTNYYSYYTPRGPGDEDSPGLPREAKSTPTKPAARSRREAKVSHEDDY
jgi:hypothetical protein